MYRDVSPSLGRSHFAVVLVPLGLPTGGGGLGQELLWRYACHNGWIRWDRAAGECQGRVCGANEVDGELTGLTTTSIWLSGLSRVGMKNGIC